MSTRARRAWSDRSRSSRPSSSFSLVESNFRVCSPEPLPPMQIHIHRHEKPRGQPREITINDAPMMLLPKARLRDNKTAYENFRRSYGVVADESTQGLHISTIQSVGTMTPLVHPKSALKSRRSSLARSEADSGISSLKRSVTFDNLTRSQTTVFQSDFDDDSDIVSQCSSDDRHFTNLELANRLPQIDHVDIDLPDHLDTFGNGEPVLANQIQYPPRPPSRPSINKRRKHTHDDEESTNQCEICGTLLSDKEKVLRSFGKVDTFLNWVMSKWGKRTELQYIPRPSYVYRGHQPHFCNFVQQIQLHNKTANVGDSIDVRDSELGDDIDFVTESNDGRWRNDSSASIRSSRSSSSGIGLTSPPTLDDYQVETKSIVADSEIQEWMTDKKKNGMHFRHFSSIPEMKEDNTLSGTEGRPGSPSSVDGHSHHDDDLHNVPVTGVEVRVMSPTKSDASVKQSPKSVDTPIKITMAVAEDDTDRDSHVGQEDNKPKTIVVDHFVIPSNQDSDNSNNDNSTTPSIRPPSPRQPPPSPEPPALPPPPTPSSTTKRRGCVNKKTKKPIDRSRKMKEIEMPKEPEPVVVEERTETPSLVHDSDPVDAQLDIKVPELPSNLDKKEKQKKDKNKPKRHLIEVEDDLLKGDPTDALSDQMKLMRSEVDWSNMDTNGVDDVKRPPQIKSWISGRLALSQQSSRFELPMDMKNLETMTPQEYIRKHCIITSRRQTLYSKIFMKNKDKTHTILFKDLEKTLKDVLVNTITSDQVKEVLTLLDINENTKVDSKLFAGMAAFAERLLYPKFLTEDTVDMPEYQKEKIECADFCALEWKFHGVSVNPQMVKLLKQIN